MKTTAILIAVICCLFAPVVHATQTASATFFCNSLRFQQGEGDFGDTLDLSTVSGTPNGELAPWYSVYTHQSVFILDSFISITGDLVLDLPPNPDANGNGFDDSLEVSQGVSGVSEGEYETVLGGGVINATWFRAAGSKFGTCHLELVDDMFGDLGTYEHTFEVIEYTGTLVYAPGSNVVTGMLNVTNETDRLQGPVSFTKSVTEPYDELTLMSGNLTNSALQTLDYFSTAFDRDLLLETNYYGFIGFVDGDLNTSAPDYYIWTLSVDDLNDSDDDDIPDFSDDPSGVSLPRQPSLSLAVTATNFLLTISGDVGFLHHILESTNLAGGNWTTNLSVTLTNDPQVVSLPLSTVRAKFWRAMVP